MNRIYYRIAYGLSFLVTVNILVACSDTGNKHESEEDEISASQDDKKEQIRLFWETYRQAQKFRKEGDFQKARDKFTQATLLDPHHEDALFNLGNMCYEMGDYGEAEAAWKKLIEVNYQSARAHFQLGNLYLRPEIEAYFNLDKAKSEFKKAVNLNRAITGPLLHLGQIALIRGELDSARFYFNSVTATNEKSAEAFFQKGYLQWLGQNNQKALTNFTSAIEVSAPEKAIEGILSEGDTRGGKTLVRPINESIFNDFLMGLKELDETSFSSEMIARYQKQQSYIKTLQSRIN